MVFFFDREFAPTIEDLLHLGTLRQVSEDFEVYGNVVTREDDVAKVYVGSGTGSDARGRARIEWHQTSRASAVYKAAAGGGKVTPISFIRIEGSQAVECTVRRTHNRQLMQFGEGAVHQMLDS